MITRRSLGFVVLSATLALATGCTKRNKNEIVIGHFGSMTGAEATFGKSTDEGIRLAVEETNAAGGIKGKQIRLITMDNQGKAEEAAAVATRLIEQEKVTALLGEVASSRSLAVAPIAQKKKVPMITPSSTNPRVTEMGDYIFRTCFIDPFQGLVMAKFAYENLKLRKVAVLRAVNSDYSMGLSKVFVEKFTEMGGQIVADTSYQSQDVDFKAQLTQIKSAGPEGIFIPGYYTEIGLIARQAAELGLKIPLMGGDGWDSPKLFEIGQETINGNYFSNHYSNESSDPVAVAFMESFKKRFNKSPDGLSAAGYDAAKVLFAAMEKAPDLSGPAIRDAIAATKDYPGVTGTITINQQRNAVKSAVVVQVQGTTNKYITTINP
ncbi:MAG: ABC transporter substrate-binding protein [Bdellovibrionaceae bacterium]|nr:ABC transporter substrate-binding protein [Pseudobdellovibrionaceae bacterium]